MVRLSQKLSQTFWNEYQPQVVCKYTPAFFWNLFFSSKSRSAVASNCFHGDLFSNLHIILQARDITVIDYYDKEYRPYRRSKKLWPILLKFQSPEIWPQYLFQPKLILFNIWTSDLFKNTVLNDFKCEAFGISKVVTSIN